MFWNEDSGGGTHAVPVGILSAVGNQLQPQAWSWVAKTFVSSLRIQIQKETSKNRMHHVVVLKEHYFFLVCGVLHCCPSVCDKVLH